MTLCDAARFGAKSALRMARLSAIMAAAITFAAVLAITGADASTLVETTNGWVQGKTVGSVDQWLGVRYAASPAGVNRWTPPKPPGSYGARQNPYAANKVVGLSVPSSAFSVTNVSCGAQVTAAYDVPTFTSGLGLPNITVHVSACYPI